MAQHHFAFGCQSLKPIAAPDDLGLQPVFQIANAHRKGGLRHATGLCRAGKVLVSRKGGQAFEVAQIEHQAPLSQFSDRRR